MICSKPGKIVIYVKQIFSIAILCGILLLSACGDDEPAVDCSMVNVSVAASTTISQCPDATGTIAVNASGGSGNFEYSIDGQNFQAGSQFQNVGGGEFTVTVRDGDGCQATTSIVVEEESDITFTTTTTGAGCGGNTGTLTINPQGGNGSFQYKVDDGQFQGENTIGDLSNGIHMVTVKDGNNCESAGEGYVKSGISFAQEVSGIITTYCAVSGCHVAGEPRPDFTIFSNVQSNALEIKSRTQSRNMPRGSSLTNEQIATIACWVDDGALDN